MTTSMTPFEIILAVLYGVGMLIQVLEKFRPNTGSNLDKTLDQIEKGKALVEQYAAPVWHVVEQMSIDGKVGTSSAKLVEYMKRLDDLAVKLNGAALPSAAKAAAETIAAGMSAAPKNAALSIPALPSPPPAPALK